MNAFVLRVSCNQLSVDCRKAQSIVWVEARCEEGEEVEEVEEDSIRHVDMV